MGVKGETFPHPSVVDDYLSTIDPEEVNQLLVELFISCQKSKIFYNHCATLLPPQSFHIGVDGFWVHHYHKPHASDEAGNNKCPYCLPRVHHKGTLQEKTTWVHVFVTFVMIFPGRLTLPIYVYPLKSKQVNASKADDDLKQECELIAARAVLPIIRKLFPRLQITFLGDSLYANHPFINLCTSLHIEFLIVRKEKSLPVVAKQCDELATLELYETHYKHHEKEKTNEGFIERKCCWFNRIYLGGIHLSMYCVLVKSVIEKVENFMHIRMNGYVPLQLRPAIVFHCVSEGVCGGTMKTYIIRPKTEALMQSMTMLELIQIYGWYGSC
jgi:hypothetical protein